jgi:hypothetical protein
MVRLSPRTFVIGNSLGSGGLRNAGWALHVNSSLRFVLSTHGEVDALVNKDHGAHRARNVTSILWRFGQLKVVSNREGMATPHGRFRSSERRRRKQTDASLFGKGITVAQSI